MKEVAWIRNLDSIYPDSCGLHSESGTILINLRFRNFNNCRINGSRPVLGGAFIAHPKGCGYQKLARSAKFLLRNFNKPRIKRIGRIVFSLNQHNPLNPRLNKLPECNEG